MHHGWKILRLQMMFDVPSYKPPFLVIFLHFPTFSHDFPTFSHGFPFETSIFHRDSLAEWPGQLHASPSRRPRQPPSTASACPSLWLWGMSAWDPRFLGEISRVQTNTINNYVLLLGHRTWGIYGNIMEYIDIIYAYIYTYMQYNHVESSTIHILRCLIFVMYK